MNIETLKSPEARSHETREGLNRKSWMLWSMMTVLLFGLTAAVALLYMPIMSGSPSVNPDLYAGAYYSLIGLAGLVVVFCLFTAMRHRELNRLRRLVAMEEAETETVNTRLSELSALFQLSTTLNLQLNLDVVIEIIVRRVVSTLKAQQASLMVYNPESGLLETRATYGLESEFARHAKQKIGEGIAGWVAQQKEAVLLDQRTEADLGRHYKNDRNITSALSLPLRVGDRCVGVLNVNRINHPEPFQERHRQLLNMFAEHVAAVIERAETLERLGTHSRELEQVNQQLSETNRLKDLFLATASNELRTPLTSVIAYAELLEENDNLKPSQRSEFLRRLRIEAERLLGLIEDILDLTKIESGKLPLKRSMLAVNDVVISAVETAKPLTKKRDLTVDTTLTKDLPPLRIDEVKLRQAVSNLVAHAAKVSPERGTITVTTDREPRFAKIEIMDTGPAISPEQATTIFELFGHGVDEGEERNDGIGIGLHLARRIAEMHGGHVGVNSLEGDGNRFWIRLPLALANEHEEMGPVVPLDVERVPLGAMLPPDEEDPERKAA